MHKRPETSVKARSFGGYRKHLRPEGKRLANKATRRLGKPDAVAVEPEAQDFAPSPAAGKRRKRWGIETYSEWFHTWHSYRWYDTEVKRDQGLAFLLKNWPRVLKRPPQYRKVNRS